jgi:hypothetical protein
VVSPCLDLCESAILFMSDQESTPPIDQYGTNSNTAGLPDAQREIAMDLQMQNDVAELSNILSQQTQVTGHTVSPQRKPALPAKKSPAAAPTAAPAPPKLPAKPPAAQPKIVIDLDDKEKTEESDDSDEEYEHDTFENEVNIQDSPYAFISAFKVIVFMAVHEEGFAPIKEDYNEMDNEALPALLQMLYKDKFGVDMQCVFKKAPDMPIQHAQIDMSMEHGIRELESFRVNDAWVDSKLWTLKDEFSFKVHIYKADYSEGYDVVKTLKLLFFDEVVVKEGVWIDVCEIPGQLVHLTNPAEVKPMRMYNGLRYVLGCLCHALKHFDDDGLHINLQKQNKNSQPRFNYSKVVIGGEKRITELKSGDWRFWFQKDGLIKYVMQYGMLPSHLVMYSKTQIGSNTVAVKWEVPLRYQPDLLVHAQLKDLHSVTVSKIKEEAKLDTIDLDSYHALFPCNRCHHVTHQWLDCPQNPKMAASSKKKREFNRVQSSTKDMMTSMIAASKSKAKRKRSSMQGMSA